MNRITLILLFGGLLVLGSCQSKQSSRIVSNPKTDGEKLVEAYQKGDFKTIVAISDTLIGEDDSMNIAILYAEALAATGNPHKALNPNRSLELCYYKISVKYANMCHYVTDPRLFYP